MSTSTTPVATQASARDPIASLNVKAVAPLLGCSPRHVYRLDDAGRMPAPVRICAFVRWRKIDIDGWIAASCWPIRPGRAQP